MHTLPLHPLLQTVVDRAFFTHNETPHTYRVLPSVYTVLGFQFSGRIHHAGENRPLATCGVTGILDAWRPFRSDAATRSLLVFFKPGGFYRVFGPVAAALGSDSLALDDVFSASLEREFADILNAPAPFAENWARLQNRLLQIMARDISFETRGALHHLEKTGGALRIEAIADKLGISRRTLERKFAAEVGTTPKHLARILRWNRIMTNLGDYADLATAALAHGYFDQAHFIHDTQRFGGESPAHLAASF